jgi:hypothetical protein
MNSPEKALLRVVVSKRGKVRPAEFRLRKGDSGLSLFRHVENPGPDVVLEAVRAAGKQGELAIAELPTALLREIGPRIVATPGDTPSGEVNAIHVEARLPFWRRVGLALQRKGFAAYFNEYVAPQIAEAAKLLD